MSYINYNTKKILLLYDNKYFLQFVGEKSGEKKDYRRELRVFITDNYTHPSAWAHTEPHRGVICIRPPERIDYNLSVLRHEIEHNISPTEQNEDYITLRAKSPERRMLHDSFRLSYY